MAKKKIDYYVFEPGIGKEDNLFPNAFALLTANKAFILAEVIAYINDSIANDTAPYGQNYVYNVDSYVQDTGSVLDAIAHDLRYGGNTNVRQLSEYYWINGIRQIGDTQVQGKIDTLIFARDLIINSIFTNTAPSQQYQTGITQVTEALNGESAAAARITAGIAILDNVIEIGTSEIPAKIPGCSTIRMQGKFTHGDILLITNTNTGEILYNFSDPANSLRVIYKAAANGGAYASGEFLSDLDFPKWFHTADYITTLLLSADTSAASVVDDIQIFTEDSVTTIRPWDFGTDAIERMRVAAPQAMLDADFEYGLQPTKWQTLALQRSYPSIYEIPGTDIIVQTIVTDASISTGSFGSSKITVSTTSPHGYVIGTPFTIKGLNQTVNGASRAEGSFLVEQILDQDSFTYFASSRVGTDENQSLWLPSIQLRQAGFYTGASIGNPVISIESNGFETSIVTRFITQEGSNRLSFSGSAPESGAPISGSAAIPAGTSVSGAVGDSSTTISVRSNTVSGQTFVEITGTAGIIPGMAIDDGNGVARFISNIAGFRLNLDGPFNQTLTGVGQTFGNVTGDIIQSIGEGATFNVSRSAGAYTVQNNEDSSTNGQNYAVGDRALILGTSLGGVTPQNDLTILITEVDSAGTVLAIGSNGISVSGGALYTGVTQTSSTAGGINFAINVTRAGGTGAYTVTAAAAGSGYAPGERMTFSGTLLGGTSPENDLEIEVQGVAFGTDAVVDFIIFQGSGASGDASYVGLASTNQTLIGAEATFDIENTLGSYIAQIDVSGVGYAQGNRILILGSQVGGEDGLNDLIINVSAVSETGSLQAVLTEGIPFAGDTITIFPALILSEEITASIPDGTVLASGAIATIEATFDSAHGLVPGASILASVNSEPFPTYTVVAGVLPSSGSWLGVAHGNGVFVAVRTSSNATAVSLDGATWTAGGNLPSSTTWTSIAAGQLGSATNFIAVASGGTAAAVSTDNGATWITSTLPSSGTWSSITYSAGRFVAVRSGSNAAAYTTDGSVWTAGTLSASATWTDVAGGTIGTLVYFVAIASGGTVASYSFDGAQTWAAAVLPASATWSSVAYGKNRFIAIASGSTSVAVSLNGTSWTLAATPTTANWNSIAFDGEHFFAVASGSAIAASTFTGTSGNWKQEALTASATWEEVAFGDGVFAVVGNNTSVNRVTLNSANHRLASGPFIVTEVPSLAVLRYPARTTGVIDDTATSISALLYSRPDAFFTHRPFDGGVQLGTGGPQHGVQAVRQSKKYIRYQSGKGIMFTTGALFAPSYTIAEATASGTAANSLITFTTDDTDHGVQPGGVVDITGMVTFEYNGRFTVESVVNNRSFRARTAVPLPSTTGVLGFGATMSVRNWQGAVVRTGPFDDQNGLMIQYDGQTMALGRRTSTFQLIGTATIAPDENVVYGAGSKFQDQLHVGDRITIRGMTHAVTSINSQVEMTVSPDFRGAAPAIGAKLCLVQDLIIPQSEWNMDKCDGTGPSGYNIDPTKMQMVGVQYSWYAVGFIEWMFRGSDGRFVFLHRLRNSNTNTEAYMRTANLPVRYEVENVGAKSWLRSAITDNASSLAVVDSKFFPISGGVLYIDNEMIRYSVRNGDILSGLTRAIVHSNFAAGQNRSYTAGPAASHAAGAGVILISTTISPVISHWGSALLTDGMFDEDRGYLFSYTSTGVSISTTRTTAFLIRLAPSVSNAIIGDLGDRDLLNRAQLLLKEISITTNPQSIADSGGIVVEGVLNPQNYPLNPSDIAWQGLSGLAQGGQPSFAQIGPGGSVNWNGGASLTTRTATVSADLDTGMVYNGVFNQRGQPLYIAYTDFVTNGPVLIGSRIFSTNPSAFTGAAGRTYTVTNATISGTSFYLINYVSNFNETQSTQNTSPNTDYRFVYPTFTGLTNRILFTQATWEASGATVGTSVAATETKFPAATSVSNVVRRVHGLATFYEVSFNQTSIQSIASGASVTFSFGNPPFAQPGETVFSFIASPGERSTLDLDTLKELTTTAIGGRGAFPNGPDVLAINVYKVSGTAVSGNLTVRWGEAQA